MRFPLLGTLLTLVLAFALGDVQVRAQQPAEIHLGKSDPQSAAIQPSSLSAIGSSLVVGNHFDQLGWSDAQIDAFVEGVRAALRGKPFPLDAAAQDAMNVIGHRIDEIDAQSEPQENSKPGELDKYMKDVCKKMGLQQSDSGLCFMIKYGAKGIRPGPDDTVVVSCSATAADGKTPLPQLSNPNARGKVSTMLPGFAEGIQMMTLGSEAVFVLPPSLSFGKGTWPPGVPPGSPLIFHMVLKDVVSN